MTHTCGVQEYRSQVHKPDPSWHEAIREGGGAHERAWAQVQTFRPPPHVDVRMHAPLHLAIDCPLPPTPDEHAAGTPCYWLYTFTIAQVAGGDSGHSWRVPPTIGIVVKRQLPAIGAFPVYPDRSKKDDRSHEAECRLVPLGSAQISTGVRPPDAR